MFQKLYLCNYSWVYFQCTLAILPFPSNVKLSTAWKVSLLQNRPLFQAICPGCLWARDNWWLLSRVQRLAGPAGGTGAFCPGWRYQPGQKVPLLSRLVAPPGTKGPTLLSRLVAPTRTKGPFCPGWCYQPGQKAPPRDSSKGSYSLLSHMYYLGERLLSRQPNPGSKTGTNSPLEPGQMARSVVVSGGWLVHLSRCDLVLQYSHPASNYMFRCCASCLLLTKHIYAEWNPIKKLTQIKSTEI